MKLSPMMQQYLDIKEEHKDCILFFRLGDFYEMFFDDAKTVSRELELTLTGKNCGLEERAPMCGVPYHAADNYLAKLVEKGYKVAICEQVEDPAAAKGIVKREVIRIVTPGTVTSQAMLKENENNYLACIYTCKEGGAIAYCDISTGELCVTEQDYDINIYDTIINEIVKIDARELIFCEHFADNNDMEKLKASLGAFTTVLPEGYFSEETAEDVIRGQFGKGAESSMGLSGRTFAVRALGALLSYLLETQKQSLGQITFCSYYEIGNHMALDKSTLRNLEITQTLYEKKVQGSLLGVLDKTKTAMGSRKMKKWLKEPLNSSAEINRRLDAVDELINNPLMENNIRECLRNIYDFERLCGRIASGNANGKDLLALKKSAAVLPEIKGETEGAESELLRKISSQIHDLEEIHDMIENAISEDAPFTVKEGGLIRDGYSAELDELKLSIKDAKLWIANLESRERERTGIKTLKVGYNKVFGYYIDVTKLNADLVPEEYIRKQTLVNNERYITPELKEMESLVLNAEAKINQLEYNIFVSIRERIENEISAIQKTSSAIAELDVLCAFSHVSVSNGYTKPVIDDSYELDIKNGRHPVVEISEGSTFVANDTYLNCEDSSLAIITGPNMSGKSTYMRQTALIVLLAQAGCFVPCDYARIGVCDRIFTRIGASDNLSQGQSTFYVEMSELSYILGCSTERSLIILDEIGRGTSTYDGLAIASATVEYLCSEKFKVRTLFATHYHELTDMEERDGVVNLNVSVSEDNGDIVFLHKIAKGSASRSYGIHVAKLAGVPQELLENAENKLINLEEKSKNKEALYEAKETLSKPKPALKTKNEQDGYLKESKSSKAGEQISFFVSDTERNILDRLDEIDIMELTPSKAIALIEELKSMAEK